ncbi:PREDICTED: cytoplasmic dynein 2 light intermediate chain 1 [Rhagoletis zephyria]|uniref:cytoplasmic dynein 2 light intermediate chain 1 n=1 Tax=Rhagoletis zephyria TaxID=28612 RepID=UPI0008116147|nr:PREDICTED: cytoplasmic dynein 2 light intermediate chain 1 [Rhagoletis zephyria]
MYEKQDTAQSEEKRETIQEIAIKLAEEQLRTLQVEIGPKERTIFVLGSKGAGKSTALAKFFDRDDNPRPTLALEYSYGRRTSGTQKQVLNVWELGALDNAEQLISVPLRMHGLEHFAAIIMLDLSQPQRVWPDLEHIYHTLRAASNKLLNAEQEQTYRERMAERIKRNVSDVESLELMPYPVVIVGGKYDLFKDFEPAVKQHLCHCLRSMAHLIGGSVLFYSAKVPKLAKILRDTMSHLGFGSPSHPFRAHVTDFNDALSIWFGTDSWDQIGSAGVLSVERIGSLLAAEMPQLNEAGGKKRKTKTQINDPAKDPGFRESIIDDMRAQKDKELQALIKESQLRGQFETIV